MRNKQTKPEVLHANIDKHLLDIYELATSNLTHLPANPYTIVYPEADIIGFVSETIRRVLFDRGIAINNVSVRQLDEFIISILRVGIDEDGFDNAVSSLTVLLEPILNYGASLDTYFDEIDINFMRDVIFDITDIVTEQYPSSIEYAQGMPYIELIRQSGFICYQCIGDKRLLKYHGIIP